MIRIAWGPILDRGCPMPNPSATAHPMRRLLSNRRGLLAGAAALMGAGLAKLGGPERAEATSGEPSTQGALIIGANGFSGTSNTGVLATQLNMNADGQAALVIAGRNAAPSNAQ